MLEIPLPGFSRYRAREDGRIIGMRLGKPLAVTPGSNGYAMHTLRADDGRTVGTTAHRVIATAFFPTAGDLASQQVRHLDGDKLNNAPVNLAWGDAAANYNDDIVRGVDRRPKPRLTEPQQFRLLWRWRMLGHDLAELLAEYGISYETAHLYWRRFRATQA